MIVSNPPEIDQESKPYWEFLKKNEHRLQQCANCSRFRFPPAPACPYCGSSGGLWVPVSGEGKVYSWIVVHHPIDPRLKEDVPFPVVLVELKEGPRILGRLVGCPIDKIKGDMPVKGKFMKVNEELTLLNFEPI